MEFTKPPLTVDEQIEQLQKRGMAIPDLGRARHYLTHINYYRLGAYWLPFEADHVTHRFEPGTRFDEVLKLYVFDRELRLLVMDAIERLEVSLRTHWAYQLAQIHGPHAYLDSSLFSKRGEHSRSVKKLTAEIDRSQETFIKHYRAKYTAPALPPVWAVAEVMSLGQLSNFYSNLKHRHDRNKIASSYHLDEVVLVSFFHHLTTVRNLCAHHSRLWNRALTVTYKLPKRGDTRLIDSLYRAEHDSEKDPEHDTDQRKIYNSLVMLEYLLTIVSPGSHWQQRLKSLFTEYPNVNPIIMGFPKNWRQLSIWK